MLAVAILRIIVVTNDGPEGHGAAKSAVIDLLENTIAGEMSSSEAREAVAPHLERFLQENSELRTTAVHQVASHG